MREWDSHDVDAQEFIRRDAALQWFLCADLAEAVNGILRNAAELLEEAEMLFRADRFARARFLACIAAEELGRAGLIREAGLTALGGDDTLWTKTMKLIRRHPRKIRRYLMSEGVALWAPADGPTAASTLGEAQGSVSEWNAEKLSSLYAEVTERLNVEVPNDEVTEDEAAEMISRVRATHDAFAFPVPTEESIRSSWRRRGEAERKLVTAIFREPLIFEEPA
jgi:AbiV family abortive infection protein